MILHKLSSATSIQGGKMEFFAWFVLVSDFSFYDDSQTDRTTFQISLRAFAETLVHKTIDTSAFSSFQCLFREGRARKHLSLQ